MDIKIYIKSFKYSTVGTRNKEQVGKYGIIPYCDSFLRLPTVVLLCN